MHLPQNLVGIGTEFMGGGRAGILTAETHGSTGGDDRADAGLLEVDEDGRRRGVGVKVVSEAAHGLVGAPEDAAGR
mgnify:CR=1 FL=1